MIGSCGLMRRIGPGGLEAGYWLHPGWTGRGLATMTAAGLVDQAFHLAGPDRVEIHHDAANTAGGAVARRLGFTEAERRPSPDTGPAAPGGNGIDVIRRMTAQQWAER
ncbi:GNAT family N-acetyltransferase [Streptomyces sp. RS10V-4]|nr:GNAT family N-acetyltransferase [Streptomyces rhizoryzae]